VLAYLVLHQGPPKLEQGSFDLGAHEPHAVVAGVAHGARQGAERLP
jgi:hypothetical protein